MHISFENAAKQPQVVDDVINIMFPWYRDQRFSKVFHNLFPDSLELNDNIKSFLGIFRDFQNLVQPDFFEKQAVDQIYEKLGVTKVQDGVFQFWTYLVQMYLVIRKNRHRPNFDNVFAFMNEFSIHDIRVVIVGQDPSPSCESSGFAFHKSICPSTENIMDSVSDEYKLVDTFVMHGKPIGLPAEKLDEYKENCNLNGWIKQGVLMINSKLTLGEDLWLDLTDCLIRHLSDNCENLVFILAGGTAAQKRKLINERQHLVVCVYHPTHPYQNDERLKWSTRLPFINANFFLFQVSLEKENMKSMIDWVQMSDFTEAQDSSSLELIPFYKRLLTVSKQAPKQSSQYAGEFVHTEYGKVLMLKRLRSGFFVVKQIDPYASLQCFKRHIYLLVEADIEEVIFPMRNNLGRTMLHEAIHRQVMDFETFRRLVYLSGDINAMDNFGNTMIMTASKHQQYQNFTEMMVNIGARAITTGGCKTTIKNESQDASIEAQFSEAVHSLEEPDCKRRKI